MNSKKTKALIEKMHDEAMERQEAGVFKAAAGGKKSATTQVYLRFLGQKRGVAFQSMQSGPWDVDVDGDSISMSPSDMIDFRHHEESHTISGVSGLKVQMAEVVGAGQLGEWRTVDVSVWQPVDEHWTKSLSRDSLLAAINRLHAERSPLVVKARAVRMEKGVTSPEFASAWFEVERITRDLEEAEAALGTAVSRGGAEGAETAWRDATVEQPDDEITVMLRLASEGDEPLAVGHHADETWWINGADPVALGLDVIGWMHVHEAAAILDKATRSDARGEVNQSTVRSPIEESEEARVLAALEEIVNSVLAATGALVAAEQTLKDSPEFKAQISGILKTLRKNVVEVDNA